MPTIATLGPASTFSELAARAYAARLGAGAEVRLYPSTRKAFAAVGTECELGVLPIESAVEGYVQPVLDLLLSGSLHIVDEMVLPVSFSFVANAATRTTVRRVHVQFMAQGQCAEFLEGLGDVQVLGTESNGESLARVLEGREGDGAIVPSFILAERSFRLVEKDVHDHEGNETRFIVLARGPGSFREGMDHKTSIAVLEGTDRPGMLSDILAAFSRRRINLLSIMSRPTKEILGKYHFFVDFEGWAGSGPVREALAEVNQCGEVRVLGSYPKVCRAAAGGGEPVFSGRSPRLGPNPFLRPGSRPQVVVAGGEGPYANARKALAGCDLGPARGKKVLVKPNAGRLCPPGSGVVTHPLVVAAVIDAFLEAGASVAVGESCIVGVKPLEALERSGIAAEARSRGVPVLDLDEGKPVEVPIPGGRAISKIKLCAPVLDFDLVVSVPVMKTHMHTVVTLSVKNMKGCLWRRSKVDLHMLPEVPGCAEKSLDVAVADMASVLLPHFAVIDGTVGLEGLGPSAGERKELDLVVAGADPLAADAVACRLMGVDPRSVPHLRLCAEAGLGTLALERIAAGPPGWERLAKPFAPVPANLAIRFPGARILDRKSCSACQSSVLLLLERHGKELLDYFPEGLVIAMGKGHDEVPAGTLCVGNCTRIHEGRGVFVPGCPPVVSAIMDEVRRRKGLA